MHSNLLAILFALSSALTIAWGTVVRHRIAEEAPAEADGKLSKAPILQVISRPLWWSGTGTALLGYGLQVIALGFGALLVVQPVLVLSLMFTLPLSARYDGRRISFGEMAWAGILTVAVAILVILGKPVAGEPHPPLSKWIPALVIGSVGLILLDRFAYTQIRRHRALLLGIVTGAVFGFVAVFSKAVVDIFVHTGWTGLVFNWETYALIFGASLGTAVQQSSFHAGALKNSLPAMSISEPIVAFSLGYAVLGEKFQVSGAGWLVMAVALVAMVVATIQLSRRSID